MLILWTRNHVEIFAEMGWTRSDFDGRNEAGSEPQIGHRSRWCLFSFLPRHIQATKPYLTSSCIYGKSMVALDQATAATDATAKRKRVVTSKPTKNGCRTCRFVSTLPIAVHTNHLMRTQDKACQMRRDAPGMCKVHYCWPYLRRLHLTTIKPYDNFSPSSSCFKKSVSRWR